MDRRDFLRGSAGTLGLAAAAGAAGSVATACTPMAPEPTGVFSCGVCSGFHSPTEAVLWTRIEPSLAPSTTSVGWEVATSPSFANVVASGTAAVSASTDHCVKVLVGSLSPDTSYWFRFGTGSTTSPVGRARTLPLPNSTPSSLRLAYGSCQSFAGGYYGAYRDMASRDLDAVVHLGDYIYEAGAIQLLRKVREEPFSTILTLDEYRARYRWYRSDPDLQAAHAAHPLVPIWDDHEITNDYDRTIFTTDPARATAAYRAWFEYQPVWPVDGTRIYRSHRWGSLGELFLLDSRQYRDTPIGEPILGILGLYVMSGDLQAAGRTMLGTNQRQWLLDGLDAAQSGGVTWKVIGNQVMIAPVRIADFDTPEKRALDPSLPKHAGLYLGIDSWDGFGWERDLVLRHIGDQGVQNVAFITGDVHSFWGAALSTDFDDPAAAKVAYEYTGGSISSPSGIIENNLAGGADGFVTDPPFDYSNIKQNGYGLVECTPSKMDVTFLQLDPRNPANTPVPKVRFTATPGVVQPSITLL